MKSKLTTIIAIAITIGNAALFYHIGRTRAVKDFKPAWDFIVQKHVELNIREERLEASETGMDL